MEYRDEDARKAHELSQVYRGLVPRQVSRQARFQLRMVANTLDDLAETFEKGSVSKGEESVADIVESNRELLDAANALDRSIYMVIDIYLKFKKQHPEEFERIREEDPGIDDLERLAQELKDNPKEL